MESRKVKMNITRHNYEEFFLMYVDNELSTADRIAVDMFVLQNADLQAELASLQQAVLSIDENIFDDKEILLKDEGISAMQEKLFLLVDNELEEGDKKELSIAISKSAELQKEWQLTQNLKAVPDESIVFAHKELLYKREPARVVAIKWWRIAAAAVLLGFGIFTGVNVYRNTSNKNPGATIETANSNKNAATNKTGLPTIIPDTNDSLLQPGPNGAANNNIADVNTGKENLAAENKNATEKLNNNKTGSTKNKINDALVNAPINKETNNLPTPLENINNNTSNKPSIANVEQSAAQKQDAQKNIALINNASATGNNDGPATATNPNARTAALNNSNNNIVLMDDEKDQKRTKFGGFLRKVRRVLERKANIGTGDEKTVTIAGFDIAIK